MNLLNQLLSRKSPLIMGIINLTDDSFYDGGVSRHRLDEQLAGFNEAGVDIIDIGAESSRPGAQRISEEEELDRIHQGFDRIVSQTDALISVDTYKPKVADVVLSRGAHIINDITGGESDELLKTVAKHGASIVLMHKQGTPKTMQDQPQYKDPVADIKSYLHQQVQMAKNAGIESIVVDPGIGFGKTLAHNTAILRQLDTFHDLDVPLLIGTSNKSFIGDLTGATVHDRLPGSLASVLAGYQKGVHIFRVHHVKETRQALDVFEAVR